jgi:hypothetical protein
MKYTPRRPTHISGLPGSGSRAEAEVKKMRAQVERNASSLRTSDMHPDDVQAAARRIAAQREALRKLERLP